MKIFTIADVPDALGPAWLQHLRDFDAKHPGCHFQVAGESPDISLAEAVKMVTVNPALTFTRIFERKKRERRA